MMIMIKIMIMMMLQLLVLMILRTHISPFWTSVDAREVTWAWISKTETTGVEIHLH